MVDIDEELRAWEGENMRRDKTDARSGWAIVGSDSRYIKAAKMIPMTVNTAEQRHAKASQVQFGRV